MMNKISFLKWGVAALVVLNLSTIVFFSTSNRPPLREGSQKIIVERLHFDAQQVAAYKKTIKKHQSNIRQKQQEMSVAKSALYKLLKGADFSKKDSLVARIGAIQIEIEQVHFGHFQEIKALCNGAQLGYFDSLTSELSAFFGERN